MNDKHKYKILIADDSDFNRAILKEILREDYETIEARNGMEAVHILRRHVGIDLLLLDIVMPEMDGFEVLSIMNRQHWIYDLPVIMISSESSSSYVDRAYDLGVTDYVSRPFDTTIIRRRVANTLMLYAKQKRLVQIIADQIYDKERNNATMINIFSHIVEFRNGESGPHILHIHILTELILERLIQKKSIYHLTERDISRICIASALHDIGKISIPEAILNKPGKLTAQEYEIIKTHTTIGAQILRDQPGFEDDPLLKTAYNICRWHHERFDGKGYPDGLSGDQIPIEAQTVSIADVYDALTNVRCYKPAYDHETAIRMIQDGECGVFNPLLMECLLELGDKLPNLIKKAEQRGGSHRILPAKLLPGKALESLSSPITAPDLPDLTPSAHQVRSKDEMIRARTKFFADHLRDIQFEYDADGKSVILSSSGAAHLHSPAHFPVGQTLHNFQINPTSLALLRQQIGLATAENPSISENIEILTGAGPVFYRIDLQTVWAQDNPNQYLGLVGQLTDIHERSLQPFGGQTAVSLIHNIQQVFDIVRLVDPKDAAVLEFVPGGNLKKTGQFCYDLWGKSEKCENCVSMVAFDRRKRVSKMEFLGDDIYQATATCIEVGGRACVMEMINKLGTTTESGIDRTELIQRMENSTRRLYIDPLTGVYNRRYFEDYQADIEDAEGIAMIDVDNFKKINDRYGHLIGDAVMKSIVKAILSCIRQTDTLLRYGGDEFLLIFQRIPQEAFNQKLWQISDAVRAVRLTQVPNIQLSISVGGARGIHPIGEAIRVADERMYRIKAKKHADPPSDEKRRM